jgi:iron complex outermembrane receptor protein
MHIRIVLGVLAMWGLAWTLPSEAQDAPAEYGATAAIKADRRGPSVGASDYRIEPGALVRVPRSDAQELLTLSPGVLLTNHAGEGHAASMFLRGFDAGEGESMETLLEGIPLNELSNHHGHGYADVTFIVPEIVRELRVVQGPFDPAQGDFAVAGTAEYSLGLRAPGLQVKSALGSFGRRRLFLGYRPPGERKRTFLGTNLERGDGFGVNRAFAKASVIGQYEAKLGQGTTLRTLAFLAAQRWDSAGAIPDAAYRARDLPCPSSKDAQFFCTFDPHQGGSAQRAGLTTVLERTQPASYLRAQAFVGVRGIRTKENYTGYTQDPRQDGMPQRGDLRDGSTSALTLGFRGLGRKRIEAFGREHAVEVGALCRYDDVHTAMDRVRSELDVPYLTDFNRSVRQTQVGAYMRGDAQLIDRLRLSLGARADAFAFQVVDKNQPSSDRIGPRLPHEATDAYGFALSPRGTLDLEVLSGLHWLTSVGGGARSSDATALSESESAPFARIWAGETGAVYSGARELLEFESRVSGYFTRVSRDLVFDAESGRNQPVGTSQRAGMLATLRGKLMHWLDLSLSTSYSRAHLTSDASGFISLSGPRVPFVPTWLARADAVLEHDLPWTPGLRGFAALGGSYVGRRALPNSAWTKPYAVLDLSLGIGYRMLELSTSVTNLLDARYRQSELSYASRFDPAALVSQLPARHFSAGAPRQWLVSLSLTAF